MSVITKEGISTIVKERVDNFELNPDINISIRYGQNDTPVSFGEHKVETFNNGLDVIVNDIMTEAEKDRLYFICTSCNCVGDTDYLTIDKNRLKPIIEHTGGMICKECYEGKESDGIRPTEDEMIIASFSEFNFISKFDQTVPEIVVKDVEYPHGVKLGTIKCFDDVDVKEASSKVSDKLKEYLKEIQNKLGTEHGSKIQNGKISRMIEQPNKTMLILELADFKRKYKLAKKANNKNDIKYYQELMKKTKDKIDITHD